MRQEFLEVGRITSTHGVMGEMRVEPWADSPADLCRFRTLYVGATHWPVKVERARVHKNMVILKLEGVTDVPGVMALRGEVLHIARSDAQLAEGQFFLADLIGLTVRDADSGAALGTLKEVLTPPAGNVYVVSGGAREYLIPAVPEFVRSIDLDANEMTVHLIEGM